MRTASRYSRSVAPLQIAQKIHACTEVYADGRENDRFCDLIDLQLLRDLLEETSLPAVREACVEIFHPWPPEVTVWPSWPDGFRQMAREIDFYTDDVEVAAAGVRALIAEIDAS